MSSSTSPTLPALDCHAHLAHDVTTEQLAALGHVAVFAVTRSLDEGEEVAHRMDPQLVWGCGVHPGKKGALSSYDADRFRNLIQRFTLVGEVGLDRRAGKLEEQKLVLRSILNVIRDLPIITSIHSAGCTKEAVQAIASAPHPGTILHWFLGTADEIRSASALGCYFSVNSAMPDDTLRLIPWDRLLPETDYPSTARRGVHRPGDIANLEAKLATIHGVPTERVRWQFYRNLRTLSLASGAIETLPEQLANLLLAT